MKKFIIAALLLITPLTSQALFDVRAGYGVNTLDTDEYGTQTADNGTGFNVDLIFEPPLISDFGIGLRYEMMTYDFNAIGVGTVSEGELDRLSVLINYRFIDLIAYLGLIGTFGISSDLETNIGGPTVSWNDKLNYSVGVEGGVNLGIITLGAEVGKLFATFESPGSTDLELDGIYAKVLAGFGF